MKRIVKVIDKNIVQVTIADTERWYIKTLEDGTEKYVPSVTWLCEYYPKGLGFYRWLANTGWNEAEAIKQAAADKGSKVHQAINDLLDGKTIEMDSLYADTETNEKKPLTLEEYEAIMSFVEWTKETKLEPIAKEIVVFNDELNYAGTMDLACLINKEPYIIDYKTSQNIWPSHELQLSAYKHACPITIPYPDKVFSVLFKDAKIAILQLGYRHNKKKFKFTEIEDKFELFLSAQKIWANECSKMTPFKKDYPTSLSLLPKEEKCGENVTPVVEK